MNQTTRKFNVSSEQPLCTLKPFNRYNDPFETEMNSSTSYANNDQVSHKSNGIGTNRPKTSIKSLRQSGLPSMNSESSPVRAMSAFCYNSPVLLKKGFQKCSGDDFKLSFDSNVKDRRDGFILLADVEKVVKETLGHDCPQWVIDKFIKLSESKASYKRLTWDDFRSIIDRALRSAELDCDGRPLTKPFWLTRPTTVDSSKLPRESVASAYVEDFRLRSTNDPASTSDLFTGTAKATRHPPGYGGHIPVDSRNPIKKDYCSATKPRESSQDAVSPSRAFGFLPGYTGHISGSGKGRVV